MPAISSLPVEIWEMTSRFAIAVPDFMDPDLAVYDLVETLCNFVCSPIADESAYWSVEKTRNQPQWFRRLGTGIYVVLSTFTCE